MDEEQSTSMTDASRIERAKQGQPDAFGELYDRYVDPIYRYILSWVGNRQDAEDLTEQVFLRSFRSIRRYRHRGLPFSAYLYRVARNELISHHRRKRQVMAFEEMESIIADSPAAEEALAHQMEQDEIVRALSALPPDYREVIRLRVLLELPTHTVAAWMGKSEGSVRILLYRALGALRRRLEPYDPRT